MNYLKGILRRNYANVPTLHKNIKVKIELRLSSSILLLRRGKGKGRFLEGSGGGAFVRFTGEEL